MNSHAAAPAAEQGPPHVHHMTPATAYHAAKLGMWLFLATEVLLFGGLFASYAIYHYLYLEEFHHASLELDWRLGALNTVVLLFSSFTVAMAVDAAQKGDNKRVTKNILVTLGCAVIFLIIKAIEYSGKYAHGLFPGAPAGEYGAWGSPEFGEAFRSYFGLYYCMTGLHAIHVLIGAGILIWVLRKSLKNRFSPTYYTPVEVGGLYWHLVDLIWIYLFPLLYLVG